MNWVIDRRTPKLMIDLVAPALQSPDVNVFMLFALNRDLLMLSRTTGMKY
jgi:hypothetical protein